MRELLMRLAQRYLERRGCHVVLPGAVEMVLSGYYVASGNGFEGYMVHPPHPRARLVALNYTVITLTPGWDGPVEGDPAPIMQPSVPWPRCHCKSCVEKGLAGHYPRGGGGADR